jgi:tryptophanyl-tRNA synthetase
MKPRLVSGVKPTGNVHLGNYFAAMRQFVELQAAYHSFVFIADLHALNQIHRPDELAGNVLEVAKAYLAVGLDPEKVTLFRQSEVPEHAELCWVFNSITSMGLLERAHAYKDAVARGEKSIMVGLFDYPVLMAADILLYRPEVVPVGQDQQQHLEMTVDIAQRFNHLFGETFPLPQALIDREMPTVPGIDGRKMSKSYDNVIGLFDSDEEIRKKVMSIKTDSRQPEEPKDPERCTVFALHKLVTPEPTLSELRQRYLEGQIGYKESKELLAESLLAFLAPIKAKKAELDARPEFVREVFARGKEMAGAEAQSTLREVKEKVGLG